jgi:hypothetical protein
MTLKAWLSADIFSDELQIPTDMALDCVNEYWTTMMCQSLNRKIEFPPLLDGESWHHLPQVINAVDLL